MTRAPDRLIPAALGVLLCGFVLVIGTRPVDEQSAWLHLAIGRQLLGGGFGWPDPWVPAAAHVYVPTEWLPAIAGYGLEQLAGPGAIAWLRAAGVALLGAALLWQAARLAEPVPALLAATVGLLGSSEALTARPQLLGLVLLAVTVSAWWSTASDLRPRWWLVPLTWLSACVHGLWSVGVAVGLLVVLGLYADGLADRGRALRLLLVPVASAVAAGLTPLGPRLLLTPVTVSSRVGDYIQEWQPTSAREPAAVAVLGMLLAVVLVAVRTRSRLPWWQVGQLVLAAGATLWMQRLVAVGAVLAVPLFAQALQVLRGAPEPAGPPSRALPALRLAAGTCLVTLLAVPLAAVRAAEPAGVPHGLDAGLGGIPPGTTVLVDKHMDSWVRWTRPELRPVQDSRAEIYTEAQHLDWARLMAAAPGWERPLDASAAAYALVLTDSALGEALRARRGWDEIGTDAGWMLLRRP